MITEPDVALTDWGLAAVAGALAWRLRRSGHSESVRNGFIVFFAAVAAAGLLGGAVHGFFLDRGNLGARILWPATLLAIGAAALAAWAIGAALAFAPTAARAVTVAAALGFMLHLSHTDKKRAFEVYAEYYLSTSGQVYWSDTHQLSVYLDDYHAALDRQLGAADRATEIITEVYRFATRRQVEACYPQLAKFLRRKRRYDPQERFQSEWYRHYRAMFADALG